MFRETCPDLVLYQRNERDGVERYTYEFSNTVNGNRHPFASTVTVRCKVHHRGVPLIQGVPLSGIGEGRSVVRLD